MKKLFLATLMLCLSILGTTHLSLAQDTKARSNDPIAQMLGQGWKIVQDGVLQRDRGAHQVETFVFGSPGFAWKLQDLQNQLRTLRLAYLATPTPELRKTILSHRQEIASTQRMITLAQAAEAKSEPLTEKVSCSINFGYSASASALTSSQGVTGTASANFSSNCAFYGEVYAYSYSTATVNGASTTQTLTDGPRSGASVTASAFTSQTGVPSCQSYAYASMTSSNLSPSSYSISATNNNCPVTTTPTPVATINGTNYVYASGGLRARPTPGPLPSAVAPSPYHLPVDLERRRRRHGEQLLPVDLSRQLNYNNTINTLGLTVTASASHTGSTSKSVDVEKDPVGSGCFVVASPDGSKAVQCP